MLETANFTVLEAQDGQDALEKAREFHPDAVILNIMMPHVDGFSVCETLRRETETASLPIIMLSGQAHLSAINKGLLAGASRYLTKPATRSNILTSLKEVLYESGGYLAPN
jgi:DNA-binding response OmpR family regulator